MAKRLGYFFGGIVLLLAIAEVVLRTKGHEPYLETPPTFTMKPKVMFINDTVLGYSCDTGRYTIDDTEGASWASTNDATGYRITTYDSVAPNDNRTVVGLFGGASTYGQFLQDNETFPFLLQTSLPGYRVRNFAVPGYGVLHTYLQITKRIPVKKGDVFLFTYFWQHDYRPSRAILKNMYSAYKAGMLKGVNFATMNENLEVSMAPYQYEIWWGSRYSALVNMLEDAYNDYMDKHDGSHEIAKRALIKLNEWCKARGCTFVLIGRKKDSVTKDTMKYCKEHGMRVTDLSDINIEGYSDNNASFNTGENPNAKANQLFANQVKQYLQAEGLIIKDTTTATN